MVTCFFIAVLSISVHISSTREYITSPNIWKGDLSILTAACDELAGDYVPARIESYEQNEAAWTVCKDETAGMLLDFCLIDVVRDDTSKDEWYYYLNGAYDSNNPISYFNWDSSQPDGDECVAFYLNNRWDAVPCGGIGILKTVLCMPASELDTMDPVPAPTKGPTTKQPTHTPSQIPTGPTNHPTASPTASPSQSPSLAPTNNPTHVPDPYCERGVISHDFIGVCCMLQCGTCGGTECAQRPGGSMACCSNIIQTASRSCTVYGPPCMMEVTPNPTTYPSVSPTTKRIVAGPGHNPTNDPIASGADHTLDATHSATTGEGDITSSVTTKPGLVLYVLLPMAVICVVITVLLCLMRFIYCKKQPSVDHVVSKDRMDQKLANTAITVPDMRPVSAGANEEENRQEAMDRSEVKEWLTNVVHLGQYASILCAHGFESMRIVASIASVSELMEVGIVNEDHLTLLMTEINNLKLRSASHVHGDLLMGEGVDVDDERADDMVLQEVDQEIFTPTGNDMANAMEADDMCIVDEVEQQMFTPEEDCINVDEEICTTKGNVIRIDDESNDMDVDDIEPQLLEANIQSNGTLM